MSKFQIGDRVQIVGASTDWNCGSIASDLGGSEYGVMWDISGLSRWPEHKLFLLGDMPVAECDLLGTVADLGPTPGLLWMNAGYVTAREAVSLASKLLQFATQEGPK